MAWYELSDPLCQATEAITSLHTTMYWAMPGPWGPSIIPVLLDWGAKWARRDRAQCSTQGFRKCQNTTKNRGRWQVRTMEVTRQNHTTKIQPVPLESWAHSTGEEGKLIPQWVEEVSEWFKSHRQKWDQHLPYTSQFPVCFTSPPTLRCSGFLPDPFQTYTEPSLSPWDPANPTRDPEGQAAFWGILGCFHWGCWGGWYIPSQAWPGLS